MSCNSLETAVKDHKKIDGIILDVSAEKETAQIVHKILSDTHQYEDLLEELHVVLTPILDGENWRAVFVDRFRTELGAFFAPSHRIDFHLRTQAHEAEWCLYASGREDIFDVLRILESNLQKPKGWDFSLDSVTNGANKFTVDFKPPRTLTDSEYDKTAAVKNWLSQRPVGYQAVIQMESAKPRKKIQKYERVLVQTVNIEGWDKLFEPAIVTQIHEGGMKFTVRFELEFDESETTEVVTRDRIRRLSKNDKVEPEVFEPADVVIYDLGSDGHHKSSMISTRHEDGTYDLTILNWEGQKHFKVPRSRLMLERESDEFYEEIPALNIKHLTEAFNSALFESGIVSGKGISDLVPRTIQIGEGCLVAASWLGGDAVMKWNGKARVEVYLYLDEENRAGKVNSQTEFKDNAVNEYLKEQGIDMQQTPEPLLKRKAAEGAMRTTKDRENFQTAFMDIVGNVAVVQLDVFPRGYGSVINFKSEMLEPPIWLPKDFIQ